MSLALVVPGILYVLLQLLGENKFALPIFYELGVPHTLDNPPSRRDADIAYAYRNEGPEPGWEQACGFANAPHRVGDITFKTLDGYDFAMGQIKTAYVVGLLPLEEEGAAQYDFTMSELMRIRQTYGVDQLQIVLVFADSALGQRQYPVMTQLAGWHGVLGLPEPIAQWANCELVLPHPLAVTVKAEAPYTHILTLVDEQKRVRGYYDGRKQKETDRLDVELRVLMQEKD